MSTLFAHTLLVSLIAQVAEPAPAADPRPPEQVLSDAGLARFNSSYIVREEFEAFQTLDWINQRMNRIATIREKVDPILRRIQDAEREYNEDKDRESAKSRESPKTDADRNSEMVHNNMQLQRYRDKVSDAEREAAP